MTQDPDTVREIAPIHAAYWRDLGLTEYVGGPFQDRSGGLISFEAPTDEHASQLVADDPFQRGGLINDWWITAWTPQ